MNGDPQWSLCITCGAWLAVQVWEHFTFVMDKKLLQFRLMPILRGLIHFYLGRLSAKLSITFSLLNIMSFFIIWLIRKSS